MDVLNSANYKLLYLYKYDKDKLYHNRFYILPQNYQLPNPLNSDQIQKLDLTNPENIDIIKQLNDNSIADYRSYWDEEQEPGEPYQKKSSGGFLLVKPEYRGTGLGQYLYILNAQLAAENGFLKHEADFGVEVDTHGLSKSSQIKKIHKVFDKIYGKLGLQMAPQPAAEFFGNTTVISGSTTTRQFCQNYIKKFPKFYNENSSWCIDASIRRGGKTKKSKTKKSKTKKSKTKKSRK
tara:strand:- start:353 stop:1060 length:708 start_codon:yes stop_codon:yes gene_type:complete